MPFQRKDYIGFDFAWYAVDSVGSVAQFETGYAPIPEKVYLDEQEYKIVDKYFSNLPNFTKTYLSPKYEKLKHRSLNQLQSLLEDRNGLYLFMDDLQENPNGTNKYELFVIPEQELKVFGLPQNIQNYLAQFVFENLIFREVETIKITNYFDCKD